MIAGVLTKNIIFTSKSLLVTVGIHTGNKRLENRIVNGAGRTNKGFTFLSCDMGTIAISDGELSGIVKHILPFTDGNDGIKLPESVLARRPDLILVSYDARNGSKVRYEYVDAVKN